MAGVVGDGLVFVTGGYPPVRPIYAIKPTASGDISLPKEKTSSDAVAWSNSNAGTYIPTPIFYDGILYTLDNGGVLELTVANYYLPNGKTITTKGIKPDIRAKDDPETARDEALPVALDELLRELR